MVETWGGDEALNEVRYSGGTTRINTSWDKTHKSLSADAQIT